MLVHCSLDNAENYNVWQCHCYCAIPGDPYQLLASTKRKGPVGQQTNTPAMTGSQLCPVDYSMCASVTNHFWVMYENPIVGNVLQANCGFPAPQLLYL